MRIRIKDIAKMANVSTATVSRVINNNPEGVGPELRQKILKIVDETGYRPNLLAKSMITNQTRTVGLLSPDIATPFFQNIIKGISDVVREKNYDMILCNIDANTPDYKQHIESLLCRDIDGIILIGFFGSITQTLAHLLADVPVVVFDYLPKSHGLVQINTNNRQSSYELVSYLLNMGHERIGCILGPERFDTVRERLKGYKKALTERGIVIDSSILMPGGFTTESAMISAQTLLDRKDVTAIYCFNDLMAYSVYKLCRQTGRRIPEDVSVVGFDDILYSELLSPPLTTVRQPSYKLGYTGANMLFVQIEKSDSIKTKKILKNTLIIRESVKKIPRIYS